jgi:DNA-binding MarR family transcriptional regulator
MSAETKVELIQKVMGASHVYGTALNELLERTLAEASGEPLQMSQVRLLLLIADTGRRYKVTDVAGFLGVTNAAASRAIDRLVQRGLIDRRESAEDRRAVELSLTPDGSALLDRFAELRNAELLELLAEYPESKLQRIASLLDELAVLLLNPEESEECLRCGLHFRNGCVVEEVLGRECVTRSHEGDEGAGGSGLVA